MAVMLYSGGVKLVMAVFVTGKTSIIRRQNGTGGWTNISFIHHQQQ